MNMHGSNGNDSETATGLAIPTSTANRPATNWITTRLENTTQLILAIWSAGAILFIAISTKKYLQYRRVVLNNAKSVQVINCKQSFNNKIPIVTSAAAHTPMLFGVINPIIVLPNMHFTQVELNMVLAHEMVHYRRKDLLVKALMLTANAIHWFNPVVYALSRQLNAACELSCDEKVVSAMNTQNRVFYGKTILQILRHSTAKQSITRDIALATNLCSSKKNFRRRLISMMNTKKMKSLQQP